MWVVTKDWGPKSVSKNKIPGDFFLLSRYFSVCTHVNFTGVNKIETMFETSRANVKFEPRSTFTFTRSLSYIASISFTRQFNVPFARNNNATVEINP